MTETVKLKSPIDGSIYAECPVADDKAVSAAVERARRGAGRLARTSIAERGRYVLAMLAESRRHERRDACPRSPGRWGGGALRRRVRRGEGTHPIMVEIAEQALKPVPGPIPKEGFRRYVKREPLGVVKGVAPWNIPTSPPSTPSCRR